MIRSISVFAVLFWLIASSSRAEVVSYTPVDKGYYLDSGFHNPNVRRTFVGWDAPNRFNSFFVLDLQSLTGDVVSASLRLEIEGYFGPNSLESFGLFPVKGGIDTLTSGHAAGPSGVAIYGDLGNGSHFGTATVSPSQLGTVIEIGLTPDAVFAINEARGRLFAIGAQNNDINIALPSQGVSFSTNDGVGLNELVLNVVPEPCTLTLLGLTMFVASWPRHLQRRLTSRCS